MAAAAGGAVAAAGAEAEAEAAAAAKAAAKAAVKAEAEEAVAASWHVAEDGRVAVRFTPTSVGPHLLHATLGGQPVLGSP